MYSRDEIPHTIYGAGFAREKHDGTFERFSLAIIQVVYTARADLVFLALSYISVRFSIKDI